MKTSPTRSRGRDAVRAATLVAGALVASLCLSVSTAGAESHAADAAAPAAGAEQSANRTAAKAVATARVRSEPSGLSGNVRSEMAADLREAFAQSQRDLSVAAREAAQPAAPKE